MSRVRNWIKETGVLLLIAGISLAVPALGQEGPAAPPASPAPAIPSPPPPAQAEAPPTAKAEAVPSRVDGAPSPVVEVEPTSMLEAAPGEADRSPTAIAPPSSGQLPRFGWDFFGPARKRLLNLEARAASGELRLPTLEQRDALTGFVGPLEMVSSSVYASVPQRYVLAPGDRLSVAFWGSLIDVQRLELVLDQQGFITVPKLGKVVARGMTLDQLQESLKLSLRNVIVKDLELVVTLDRLKSIQIFITGEAFRPGSYAVSAVTTLFNALHACGGPTEWGSLRDIRLIRGQQMTRIDFYDYLMRGESHNDLPLQAGDTLFIPAADRLVAIAGEVRQPGIYELRDGEELRSVVALAQGIKPTGLLEKIQVRSVDPHREKKIFDADLSAPDGPDCRLCNGDAVLVRSIFPEPENFVTLVGAVEMPGVYELKPGMRLADLLSGINRPLGEAHLERADILRWNDDKRTTRLLTVHLGRALAGEAAENIELARRDEVVVYARSDVAFVPPRRVSVAGAVQRPGEFERADGMRLGDLLVKTGGLLPHAYLPRADLLRYSFRNEITTIVPIDLQKALAGDPAHNVPIADRDRLRVYTIQETAFQPPHSVAIFGAVQRPDTYPRSEGMTLRDLLFAAGGPVPGFHEEAEIVRTSEKGEVTVLKVNLRRLFEGSESENVLLEDEDVIMVRKQTEFFDRPVYVTITGEVRYAGTYALRSRQDRLSELIARAGGFTALAYPKGTVFLRPGDLLALEEQQQDLARVNEVVNLLNPLEFDRQLARSRFLMMKESLADQQVLPLQGAGTVVSSGDAGEAAAIGMAPGVAQAAGTTVDRGFSAFAALPSVASPARQLGAEDLRASRRIIVDTERALSRPGSDADIQLRQGDVIHIAPQPRTVSVVGAVMRPTTVAARDGARLYDYVRLSGGYADDANIEKVVVLRMDGSILPGQEETLFGTRTLAAEPGDVIYVPPKVVTLAIEDRTDKILNTVRYALTTAAGVAVFIALIGLF